MNLFQEAKQVLDKDGKVNPLGPYGRQKLTGREVSTYFRRNKVKDAKIKKAVEVALDLGGAMQVAMKSIKDFYGDKILKSKEVQNALRYANEEVSFTLDMINEAEISVDHENPRDRGDEKKFKKVIQIGRKAKIELLDGGGRGYRARGNKSQIKKFRDMMSKEFGKSISFSEDAEAKAKLALKHAQDSQRLKDKQAQEKERMSNAESVENAQYQVKFNEFDTVRKMWEDALEKKNLKESNLKEVSLDNNMMQRNFANVWATKDAKVYRVLAQLISQDGFVDNAKAYKKNPKDYLDRLKNIAKNPKKYEKSFGRNFAQYINKPKPGQNYAKLPESINEVTDKEINMAKKLSKDMEKVKKGYQQIAKTGDKTLKNTGFNPTYEAILKAQQKVLSLIGELNTMKMISDRAASRQKDSKGRPIMSSNIMDSYRQMHEDNLIKLIDESKMGQLLIDIQQGATAKEIAKDFKIPLSVAKDFLKDYYMQKRNNRKAYESVILEKKEMNPKVIEKIAKLTDRNEHNDSLLLLAKELKDRDAIKLLNSIKDMHKVYNSMPRELLDLRNRIFDNLMRQSSSKYSNHKDVYGAM